MHRQRRSAALGFTPPSLLLSPGGSSKVSPSPQVWAEEPVGRGEGHVFTVGGRTLRFPRCAWRRGPCRVWALAGGRAAGARSWPEAEDGGSERRGQRSLCSEYPWSPSSRRRPLLCTCSIPLLKGLSFPWILVRFCSSPTSAALSSASCKAADSIRWIFLFVPGLRGTNPRVTRGGGGRLEMPKRPGLHAAKPLGMREHV